MHMFLGLKLVFSLFKKLYGATLMNPALVYTYNLFIRIPTYLYFWVSNSLFPLFKKMYGATKFVRETNFGSALVYITTIFSSLMKNWIGNLMA